MNNYEIYADSAANLTEEQAEALGVNIISMNYIENGEVHPGYIPGNVKHLSEFYADMRKGKVMTTTSINENEYIDAFTPALKKSCDILYICFSSAMSSNYSNSLNAVRTLAEKYPDRVIRVFDSLSGCCGQGLLAYHAAILKEGGKSMDEVTEWLEANKLNVAHWFTVEDLKYLFRGGRVSRTAYIFGALAHIKPIMHLTEAGVMAAHSKVFGRKRSIQKIAEKIAASIVQPEKQVVFINHADCAEDAEFLVKNLRDRMDAKEYCVNMLDPVMGSHAGPGSIAAFCLATTR